MASQRSRRVTLPGADEMFFRSGGTVSEPDAQTRRRHVGSGEEREGEGAGRVPGGPAQDPASGDAAPSGGAVARRAPKPSGRQRHDEKITVYISGPELLALEQTRLSLRAEHGLSADRGRLVREAVAVLLADFEEHGAASMLVRRLSED
ncbi:hypothetical protein [Nocardiopsis sp. CNT312]|uniref:hypothetical protein n=1 Tax=Nocardiopsis sp. CNT312 TaxID=1137268 RepID=UPI0004B216E7|nr:hypothetical protein [Nocardiopsis sp. CNT312]